MGFILDEVAGNLSFVEVILSEESVDKLFGRETTKFSSSMSNNPISKAVVVVSIFVVYNKLPSFILGHKTFFIPNI